MASSSNMIASMLKPPSMIPQVDRPPKFRNGMNFAMWQSKMFFMLTQMEATRFVEQGPPAEAAADADDETKAKAAKELAEWKSGDFLVHNTIVNNLDDSLWSVYHQKTPAKVLWDTLNHEFKGQELGSKKWIVGKFLKYSMVDSKSVVDHLHCQLKGVRLPLNLKKLSLSDFSFTWGDFSTIGKLPNLNILKLVSIAFDSPIWEMSDDEFLQLEYLKLDSLKITEWNVESDPVPNIKQLVLRNCIRLNEVPVSFGDIDTLEMIELKWCSASAEVSVMTILEQKLEYGYEGFKAFIDGFVADPKFFNDD